jgi:hypothetical protein
MARGRRPYRGLAVAVVGALATATISFAIQGSGPQANAADQRADRSAACRAVDRDWGTMQLAEPKALLADEEPVSEVTTRGRFNLENADLQFIYFYRENNVALGQVGILNPALQPANYAEIDVQGEIADGGDNHFTYWGFEDGSGWNDGAMNRVFENLT